MSNLTYLCPNCHRKAHNNKLKSFVNLKDALGDSWKAYLNPKLENPWAEARKIKAEKQKEIIKEKISKLDSALIDKTKYGWSAKAAKVLDVHPRAVIRFLRRHAPLYLEGAYIQRSNMV